jgi:SOS-response transcriptional repressor LexA
MANKKRLPRYGRTSKPPTIRLTERDHRILEAIHSFDGMLGFSQIRRMFFTGKSQAEERLKLLYQNGYLNRPNREQRLRMPEMVYWLDRKGAEIVASLTGVPLLEMG